MLRRSVSKKWNDDPTAQQILSLYNDAPWLSSPRYLAVGGTPDQSQVAIIRTFLRRVEADPAYKAQLLAKKAFEEKKIALWGHQTCFPLPPYARYLWFWRN